MQTTKFNELKLSQLMLGTAQFGLPYGVANRSGQPSFREVCEILRAASEGGVNCLDTAPIYGESESVLGRALETTKLSGEMIVVSKCLRAVGASMTESEVGPILEREVLGSLERLQLETLPICLFHTEESFRYIDALLKLKTRGLVGHVGCSAVSPGAAREIIASGLCEAIQIPTSILDRRFHGVVEEAAARGVAVFARSTYLQGLILMAPEEVPDDLQAVIPALQELRALAQEFDLSIEELALRYVLGLRGLTCAVVGVESVGQMRRNLDIFYQGALDTALLERIKNLSFDLPALLFEPWRWQKRMPDVKPLA